MFLQKKYIHLLCTFKNKKITNNKPNHICLVDTFSLYKNLPSIFITFYLCTDRPFYIKS